MNQRSLVLHLASNDWRVIVRDRFLVGSLLFMLAYAVLLRFLIPGLSNWLMSEKAFDFTPYLPLIASASAIMGALLVGVMMGFVLLEEREERVTDALLVSPIPLHVYLGYRVSGPLVFGALAIFGCAVLIDVAVPPTWPLVWIAVVGSTFGAMVALVVPSTADNKIEAFAIGKIISASTLIPLGAFFVREPWQYLAGVYPPYWVYKAYWVVGDGGWAWLAYLACGALTASGVLWLLVRRFHTVAYRG